MARYDHIEEVKKFNPYHGAHGYFSTANAATSMTIRTKDPSKQHWADMAAERAKANASGSGSSQKQKISSIESEIRGQSYETVAVVDKNGTVVLRKDGNKNSVGFEKKEVALMEDCTLTHNHPSNGTLSKEDVDMFAGNKLEEIRAVGRGGDTYSLSKGENYDQYDALMFAMAYSVQDGDSIRKAQRTLDDKGYAEKIRSGEITHAQANKEFNRIVNEENDKWLQKNASHYGLVFVHEKSGVTKGMFMKANRKEEPQGDEILDKESNEMHKAAFNEWLRRHGLDRHDTIEETE